MGLTAPATAPASGASGDAIALLLPGDADAVVRFYAESYPGSYFEPVNLVRGPYLAIRDRQGIAAIAGVHVYSPATRIASLGNIATRPDARGRGYARRVTAALCDRLRAEIDVIGLNVRADNAAAIACYRAVGFERFDAYDEWLLTRGDGA
jgi:ribosomal protein S18 acetylase RimI-like enzyme